MPVAATVAELMTPASLAMIEQAFMPPPERRAAVTFELEIEAAGEGTWVLRSGPTGLAAKKGFAKSPLLSVRLGKGAFTVVREQLALALDGFVAAPELSRRLAAARELTPTTAALAHGALVKLAEGLCVHLDIVGAGRISVARGPVDEATKELTVSIDDKALRAVWSGAPLSSLSPRMQGDRTVGTAALSALAPIVTALRL
jgi:hypothetical protein